ncbi:MAG: DUF4440 domain-containing protein [Planctomycetota bacterium]
MYKKPEDFLKAWMQAVNKGDLQSLLSFYNVRAVLLPTFSNRLLTKPNEIREYFEKLFTRDDVSLALHEKTFAVQPVKNEVYALHGIYCWRFAIEGELFSFEARFSYVIDLSLPSPILQHHSSQVPRML